MPDRDRDGLLRCADALVFPSRYEGFGAPVLEAMAVGMSGDRGGRHRAARGARPPRPDPAGLLLDPDDGAGWADAVGRCSTTRDLRARLIGAGHARAAELTDVQSARALATAYRGALAR